VAINAAGKTNHYALALQFAERLQQLVERMQQLVADLEPVCLPIVIGDQSAVRHFEQLALAVQAKCRARGGQDAMSLVTYEPTRPHWLCPASLTPIFTDTPTTVTVPCKRCDTQYQAQFADQQCRLCGTGTLFSYPVMSARVFTGGKASVPCKHVDTGPPLHAQQDEWTDGELELYDDLARSLGLNPDVHK
jgi:hypothetical protein